jgi:imidazolonepropionase-like amidohydrolase
MQAVRAAFAFDGERFVEGGATCLVDGTRIVGVEPASYVVPAGCPVTDHGGATVLPGLIDTHVHLVGDSGPLALERVADRSEAELAAVVDRALRQHLAAGVTTVRDLGDRRFNVVERRDAQRAHDDGLPWIVASGPPITSPGGHCHFLGGEVAGADDLVSAVRERVERGVDVVKVMASGGMNTPGTDVAAAQFTVDALRLLVDEAHRAGLPVTAHAHAAVAVDQAVAVGVDGIEHGSYLVRGVLSGLAGLMNIGASDRQLAELAASGIPVCPTLGGFTPALFEHAPPQARQLIAEAGVTPEQIVATRMALLGRMHEVGVRLVSGTDAGIAPPKAHGLFANAVIELATVLPVPEALATATSDAARVCGLGGSKGRLRAGYDADLLVVDGDLSQDVTALRRVRRVVVRGRPGWP